VICGALIKIQVIKINAKVKELPKSDVKTRKKHAPRYTSIDLMYDTLGKAAFVEAINVVMVSTVVTPSPTRAGEAPRLSQKETQEMITIRLDGM
jgi:hypothetical protein